MRDFAVDESKFCFMELKLEDQEKKLLIFQILKNCGFSSFDSFGKINDQGWNLNSSENN